MLTSLLPGVCSTAQEQYLAATEAAGFVDRSYLGRLEVSGADGLDLLNRLSTNKLDDLGIGDGAITVLTSNKGRIVDLLHVLRLEDRLLVLTGPENRAKVAEWIDLYTFVEDVTVTDVTEETAMLSVIGPKAESIIIGLCGDSAMPAPEGAAAVSADGVSATLVRCSDIGRLPEYALVAPRADAESLWQAMLRTGADEGALPVGMDAFEAIRVENRVPAPGKELTEGYNPLEAGLLNRVSFNKGCYIGQEVVTRLDTYKKVQKHLVGLEFDGDSTPGEGATLFSDGKKAGTVTSVAVSPGTGRAVGLGYVKKSRADSGTRLNVGSDAGPITGVAVVVDAPEPVEVSQPGLS